MNARQLVFVGGAHGVGKTTVIEMVKQDITECGVYDPGELFWTFHYRQRVLLPSVIEEMIAGSLQGTARRTTIVNWHYAVWTPAGYIPQIAWRLWERVAKTREISNLALVLLSASPAEIHERRKQDCERGAKKRKLDVRCVKTEVIMQRLFFAYHVGIAMRYRNALVIKEIFNHRAEIAAQHLENVLRLTQLSSRHRPRPSAGVFLYPPYSSPLGGRIWWEVFCCQKK